MFCSSAVVCLAATLGGFTPPVAMECAAQAPNQVQLKRLVPIGNGIAL